MNYQNEFQQTEQPAQTFLSCFTYTGAADYTYPDHCHSYYEITYVFRGRRHERINGESHEVEAGSLVFIPPLAVHGLHNLSEVEDLVIQFDHLFVRNSSILFANNHMLKPVEIAPKDAGGLAAVFAEMRECCRRREVAAEKLTLDMKLSGLCLEALFQLLDNGLVYVDRDGVAYRDLIELNPLISGIITHPGKPISMSEACRLAGMSYSHFGRFFEKMTGFHYKHFCNLFRIRHAEELLLSTDKTISEVAEAVGIGTLSYFTRLFKQTNGNTPSEYRRRYRV